MVGPGRTSTESTPLPSALTFCAQGCTTLASMIEPGGTTSAKRSFSSSAEAGVLLPSAHSAAAARTAVTRRFIVSPVRESGRSLGRFVRDFLILNALERGLDMAREDIIRRPLLIERDLWRHLAFGFDAAQRNAERLQRMLCCIHDGGRLVAAMDHAVGTFLVIAGAVFIPLGRLH